MRWEDSEDKKEVEGGISQFDEEYLYWIRQGYDHTSAKNKAIDWYRKFGSREVTVSSFTPPEDKSEIFEDELLGPDSRPTQDRISELSNLVRKFLEGTKSERDRKYFVILLRAHGLDENLDDDTFDLLETVTEVRPASHKRMDIAKAMGFKVKDNGSTSSMHTVHNSVKAKFVELFGGI